MIPYNPTRRANSDAYNSTITRAVEIGLGLTYCRESNTSEDFRGVDHFFTGRTTFQYKVQHSPTFRTWTVQVGMWPYDVDYYAFCHVRTRRVYIIEGSVLKTLPRSLYNGPASNQPFYFGDLDELETAGAVIVGFDGTLISDGSQDWW